MLFCGQTPALPLDAFLNMLIGFAQDAGKNMLHLVVGAARAGQSARQLKGNLDLQVKFIGCVGEIQCASSAVEVCQRVGVIGTDPAQMILQL